MPLDEPAWWYGAPDALMPRLLAPAAALWSRAARRRAARTAAYRAALPVICVGNFTAGGTGKTPLAMHIVGQLRELGRTPALLTRGYGGREAGPRWVETATDTAALVGDEPLLLARVAPTIVSRDRAQGARFLESARHGAGAVPIDVLVMDDGLQNPGLVKTLSIAVVDGRRGFGNGRVIPAGPLRAPLEPQLRLVDAIVASVPPGAGAEDLPVVTWLRQHFAGPVILAGIEAAAAPDWLASEPIVAYAAIGAPQRFFDLLAGLGARPVATRSFRDHHALTSREADALMTLARRHGARLVTTQKDWVRLTGAGEAAAALQAASYALAIRTHLAPRDAERLKAVLAAALAAPAGA